MSNDLSPLNTSDITTVFPEISSDETTTTSPHAYQVWGYGLLLVTAINLCSLLGVVVNPLSKRHIYSTILLFMVSLAVGVLAGSSLLFLLAGALEIDSAEWHVQRNYFEKVTIALSTVFVFFNFEQFLKLILAKVVERRKNLLSASEKPLCPCGNGTDASKPVLPDNCTCHAAQEGEEAKGLKMKHSKSPSPESGIRMSALPVSTFTHHHPNTRGSAVPGITMGLTAGQLPCVTSDEETDGNDEEVFVDKAAKITEAHPTNSISMKMTGRQSVRRAVSVSANDSVSSYKAKNFSEVQPVAWMVIFGDGIHNFVDGLSIGAGMSRSFPEGLSIAIAVMAEELPHELGDLAVLLRAGLSLKQALSFNFLSACLCYLGFIIGAIVGEFPNANTIIYSIAAGLFLYIALTDLLPELSPESMPQGKATSDSMVHVSSKEHNHLYIKSPRKKETSISLSDSSVLRKHSSLSHLFTHLIIADTGMLVGYLSILLLAVYAENIEKAMHFQ